ncbi:MAG TPA: hypothetical protein VFH03_21135 [Actinoplanes sp.]|nr:hypothetical protein [Actinoplanes sp.]
MYVVLAWFSNRSVPTPDRAAARERAEAELAGVVPSSYVRHEFGGDDWGVTVLHRSEQGAYRWPTVAADDAVTTVSMGLPVGVEVTGGPVALGRRMLAGEDVHRTVVPPFALLAWDGREFAVQQDWLGMCRLFTGAADGVTVLCSRPGLVATFLHGRPQADPDGWASYAAAGMFGGDTSPVSGVRLLRAGERISAVHRSGGGWDVRTSTRYAVDDVVMSGFEDQGRSLSSVLDRAATAMTDVAAGVDALYDGDITLGLSGGKDSRLIAASMVSAGRPARFSTNDDSPSEGEVARRLTAILRDQRGLPVEHRVVPAAAPANVLQVGLRERAVRLQRMYDFQFPATYLVRPAVRERLRNEATPATLTGAAGELATGAWYPRGDRTPVEQLLAKILGAMPAEAVADGVMAVQRDRILGLVAHAQDLGLHDEHLIDYVFLADRLRRMCTSAYALGMVTPFLAPGFVAASFALTPAQKRDRLLHTQLTERLVPEWAGVPYANDATGPSAETRIWEGDGVRVMADLLDSAHGAITGLIRRPAVERALARAVQRNRACSRTLRQFTWLAVASVQLEPDWVRPVTGETYARVTAPPPAAVIPPQRRRRSWRNAMRRPAHTARKLINPSWWAGR